MTDESIRAELDAYRAETRAFRAEVAAWRAEDRAIWARLEIRLDRLDTDVQALSRYLADNLPPRENGA